MSNRVLEICVESVDYARAAERAGAHRIEFCSDLSCGGVTPSAELMQAARRYVKIPIHVLIRPRAGDFVYSEDELGVMRKDVLAAKQLGMNGVVLGILRENRLVDIERTKAFVELAHPLPVTFHRAFDASENLEDALEDVIQTGASRILTSGGQPRAMDALSTLARLVQVAKGRILVMPGGGINSDNLVRIVQTTLADEVHSSAGTSNYGSSGNGSGTSLDNDSVGSGSREEPVEQSDQFERKVASLVSLLDGLAHSQRVP